MGVDVDPEFIIGKQFNSREEAEQWLEKNYPEKYAEYVLNNCDDIELTFEEIGLTCRDISAYADYGYVVGLEVYNAVLDPSGKMLKELWEQATVVFGKEAAPHFWARYW